MNKSVRARGCWRIRMAVPNDGRGWVETRRILKTFAVLLIFFSKWVKLFYDFRSQFLATGGSLSLSLSFLFLTFFHRHGAWRRHVHLVRLIFSLEPPFSPTANMYSSFVVPVVHLANECKYHRVNFSILFSQLTSQFMANLNGSL